MRAIYSRLLECLGSKTRKYSIGGSICFELTSPPTQDLKEEMHLAIREAEQSSPWRDVDGRTPLVTIYPSYGSEDSETIGLRAWRFDLSPFHWIVPKGKVYAFEKFMQTLADKLSAREIGGVGKIVTTFSMRSIHQGSHDEQEAA